MKIPVDIRNPHSLTDRQTASRDVEPLLTNHPRQLHSRCFTQSELCWGKGFERPLCLHFDYMALSALI